MGCITSKYSALLDELDIHYTGKKISDPNFTTLNVYYNVLRNNCFMENLNDAVSLVLQDKCLDSQQFLLKLELPSSLHAMPYLYLSVKVICGIALFKSKYIDKATPFRFDSGQFVTINKVAYFPSLIRANGQFYLIILSYGIKADIKRCKYNIASGESDKYDIAMAYYAANKDTPILATYYANTDYSTNSDDEAPPPLIPAANKVNLLDEIYN